MSVRTALALVLLLSLISGFIIPLHSVTPVPTDLMSSNRYNGIIQPHINSYSTLKRDLRSYRLAEINAYNVHYGTIIPYLSENETFYYNASNPAQLDSIRYLRITSDTENMEYYFTLIFTYDAQNINPISEMCINTMTNQYRWHRNYQYDANGNLTRLDMHNSINNDQLVTRHEFTYNGNSLIQQHFITYIPDGQEDISHQVIIEYNHDQAGRIAGTLSRVSWDEINWQVTKRETMTYNPADTSHGEEIVELLRNMYLMFHVLGSNVYGMIDTLIVESCNEDSLWIPCERYLYQYDDNNSVSQIYQNYNADWENILQLTSQYDNNGMLATYLFQQWDTDTANWDPCGSSNVYSWEQYTSNPEEPLPTVTLKLSAYPNPFASNVNIRLDSKSNTPVKASIYNIKGQLIKALGNGKSLSWDGKDTNNQNVSNGIYFVKAEQDGKAVTSKIIRIR
jgi:hypothetical protein